MIYKVKGEDAIFTIDFKVDGEFAIPDVNSVWVSVRDNTLINYPAYNHQLIIGITTSSYELVVDSIVQASSDVQSLRFVTVEYKVAGKTYLNRFSYSVIDFLPYTITEEDVRNVFGAEYREIPDSVFDIPFQYFKLNRDYGVSFKDAYLDSVAYAHANNALKYASALAVVISTPQRILKRERTSDTSEFERQKIDFTLLEAQMTAAFTREVALTLEAMGGTDTSATSAEYPIFIVSTPTDVITNT